MPDNDYSAVMAFVSSDTSDFNIDDFMKLWPEDETSQRILSAMLLVRTAREVTRQSKSINTLWYITAAAVLIGTAGLAHVLGADQFLSAMAGLGAGVLVQMIKVGLAS